jgi:glucose/mannose-6-phosphate isomerase
VRYADDLLLDDADALAAADPGNLLRATADAGAQVRRALAATDPDVLHAVAADGRPRSVIVAGSGVAGIAGDILAAVCGTGCPVAVTTLRGSTLPGWVGPLDLVIAVSASGTTPETLTVVGEAQKRGARLVGIGPTGSPLHDLVASAAGSVHVVADAGSLLPRAALWLVTVPVLLVADALRLVSVPRSLLDEVADLLDQRSVECGPATPLADNPAKLLGVSLATSLPVVWGSSPLGAVAAYRLATQLGANAKIPALHGSITEATHHQVAVVDGAFASGPDDDDIFRDPIEDGAAAPRLRLVLLRDPGEHPVDAQHAVEVRAIAERRDVPVDVVHAVEGHAVLRLASVVGLLDWASVYAAVAVGVDPSAVRADIAELTDVVGRGGV